MNKLELISESVTAQADMTNVVIGLSIITAIATVFVLGWLWSKK